MSCSCSSDDYESPAVFHETDRRSKRPRRCSECGENIEKGQPYVDQAGIWDGKWDHIPVCQVCWQIAQDFCPQGRAFGSLRETIWECFDVDYVDGSYREWVDGVCTMYDLDGSEQ